jgi:hypothetical protein
MGTVTLSLAACAGRAGAKRARCRKNVGVKRPGFDHQKRRLLVCSLVIAGGLVMIILGFMSSVTGRKALALPATIENIDPVRGAVRVPAQTEVFVDLLAGYTGVLVVDGVELQTVDPNDPNDPFAVSKPPPGQEVTLPPTTIYERGNATLTFVPTKGARIESFAQGNHSATVIFWKIVGGSRQRASTYTWTFSVF